MIQKIFILCILTFFSQLLCAQYNNQLGFQTDNDTYVPPFSDEYYTNGLCIYFNKYFFSHPEEVQVVGLEVGQHIYTANDIRVVNPLRHDRPYAGYLYLKGTYGRNFGERTFVSGGAELGTVGENALAEKSQELIHTIFNFEEPGGWDSQIKNQVGFALSGAVQQSLMPNVENEEFVGGLDFQMGNQFRNVAVGFAYLTGNLAPLPKSAWVNAKTDKDLENYFYFKPSVKLVFYDVTIQGSKNNDDPVTFDVKPVVGFLQAGYERHVNHWAMSFAFTARTKDIESSRARSSHQYGSIGFAYRF